MTSQQPILVDVDDSTATQAALKEAIKALDKKKEEEEKKKELDAKQAKEDSMYTAAPKIRRKDGSVAELMNPTTVGVNNEPRVSYIVLIMI